ncbi:MAG: metallopeptidase family protein [Chloroflexi bacterium]|nr:metallopeptidase family protein [Chloroflexota bacterium]
MFEVDQELFEDLVAEALAALPDAFQERLDNVAVVVEDWPDRATLRQARLRHPDELLGFYHGVPQTHRGSHYGLTPPDKISIYRWPIVRRCRTVEELRAMITRVLLHELAHHFGIEDDRLAELNAY